MVLKTYWFGRGWDHNGLVGGPPRSCVKALLIKYRVSGRPPAQAGSEMSQPLWAEITRGERGYCLSQVSYIRELLQLYGCEGQAQVPISKWTEPEQEGAPEPSLVKEAQGITGALLWVATRSRPDISYAVSRMGQQATKVPQLSISIGRQVLQYLNSTHWHGRAPGRHSLH